MSSLEIMKSIDEFTLKQVEALKLSAPFQQFLETYSEWDEKIQNLFRGALIILVILIPLFFIFSFYLLNSSTHNSLKQKEKIIDLASKVITQTQAITKNSTLYLAKQVSSQNNLENLIKNNLSSLGIDSTKMTVANFNSEEDKSITKINADISFKDFTSNHFFSFLSYLTTGNRKMRIDEIDIKKNTQTNLLEGTITINHFSKAVEPSY